MPTAPLHPCPGSPHCRRLVKRGLCDECAHKREQRRGSRHERGYDAAWVALRDGFMADPAHRSCYDCAERGVQEPATECDHVIPFKGLDDPLRLDRTNLRALCGLCHRRKTAAQQRPAGVVWNGTMDRRGECPTLIDGTFSRPSTIAPANVMRMGLPPDSPE